MPHNDLTEYGVLVALVGNEGKRWDELRIELKSSDFFDPNHHIIFTELERLADAGEKLTAYTLGIRISERHGIEHPAVRIAVGLDSEQTMSDPIVLIKQLKNYSLRRRLIGQLAAATERAYDLSEEHPGMIIDEVIEKVVDQSNTELSRDQLKKQAMPLLLDPVREELAYLKENGKPRQFLLSGFNMFDEVTWGGFRPGQLYVLGGRPGTGKTSMALNICENIMSSNALNEADEDLTIAFFSLEQTTEEIATKILCAMSDVPYGKFKTGAMSADEEMRVERACTDVETYCKNFIVLNPNGLTITDFIHSARQIKRTYGRLDLVVVDYIGLMSPATNKQYQNRTTEIAEITRGMKLLAIQEKIPILALAQVNRNSEDRASSRRPRLSDLRDSGAIEQDADLVMFLYHEENETVKSDYNKFELIVAKNRHGRVSTINLQFKEAITVFSEHDQQSEPLPDTD